MTAFLHDVAAFRFLQYALVAGVLAALAAGVVGSLVVVRRTTYLAGSISHGVLAGLGLARYLQRVHHVTWLSPTLGAVAAAVVAALLVAFAGRRGQSRNDSVLSAIWAVGMALGFSFMAATPGYQDDLMSYLFGSILMVGPSQMLVMAVLGVIVVGAAIACFDRFLAIGFSAEMARLRGVPVMLYECIFLVLTALTVVLLVQVVGIVLAIALLTLPAATAGLLTHRLDRMMLWATLIGVGVTVGGLALSYAPEWPAGATIVELAAVVYALVAGGRWVWRRLARRAH